MPTIPNGHEIKPETPYVHIHAPLAIASTVQFSQTPFHKRKRMHAHTKRGVSHSINRNRVVAPMHCHHPLTQGSSPTWRRRPSPS